MAVDVMSIPSTVVTELVWYSPKETTPFAVCGVIGPVLATVPFSKYGAMVREVWFGDNGWAHLDGEPIDEDDILSFAIPRPFYMAQLERVGDALGEVYEDQSEFEAWLDSPQSVVGGMVPRAMLEAGQGEQLVEAILTRSMRGRM